MQNFQGIHSITVVTVQGRPFLNEFEEFLRTLAETNGEKTRRALTSSFLKSRTNKDLREMKSIMDDEVRRRAAFNAAMDG